MKPRPAPSQAERIIAEVMFLVGILALCEILVRGLGFNRLLITVTLLVVAYLIRGGITLFKRWGRADDVPPEPEG